MYQANTEAVFVQFMIACKMFQVSAWPVQVSKGNDLPGRGSLCGGLWTTGLQDRLVRTIAAIISSISTDSGLLYLRKNKNLVN